MLFYAYLYEKIPILYYQNLFFMSISTFTVYYILHTMSTLNIENTEMADWNMESDTETNEMKYGRKRSRNRRSKKPCWRGYHRVKSKRAYTSGSCAKNFMEDIGPTSLKF